MIKIISFKVLARVVLSSVKEHCYEVKQVKADFIQFEYIFHTLKCGEIE